MQGEPVQLVLTDLLPPTENKATTKIEELLASKWFTHVYDPLLKHPTFSDLILKRELGGIVTLIFRSFADLLDLLEEKRSEATNLRMVRTDSGEDHPTCTFVVVAVGTLDSQEIFGTFKVNRLGEPL
jgi:hypothetical protein